VDWALVKAPNVVTISNICAYGFSRWRCEQRLQAALVHVLRARAYTPAGCFCQCTQIQPNPAKIHLVAQMERTQCITTPHTATRLLPLTCESK
jgi:hypothetical protein